MVEDQSPSGPDLTQGVPVAALDEGKLLGHVGQRDVLLLRVEDEIYGIDAYCSHYHGPLAEGLVVENTVRCPWHHACFDLRSGEAIRAPALSSLSCWHVDKRDGHLFVQHKRDDQKLAQPSQSAAPERIVIIGGGAAGFAAAQMLRRRDFQGSIVMLSADSAAPVDRPNLSKDYLAGSAPEEWLPLRPDNYYSKAKIDLRLRTEVSSIDTSSQVVVTAGGEKIPYDRLLLATGAEPVSLTLPGADQTNVYTLRTLDDSRAIIGAAKTARRAVVIGASFIGLEVAAALRAREIEVHVVAPSKRPMERVLGSQMGDFIRAIHEEHGVIFHLEDKAVAIEGLNVRLESGAVHEVDFVVAGVGVRPRLALAEQAGLALDNGVVVDSYLETSVPGIYAAGDIARWPDPHSGQNIRVEHWVVAERQGQVAALNMLGQQQKFDAVPFFWSQHYDVPINYVGHAEKWDTIVVDGDIKAKDCMLQYKSGGRVLATASIYRDIESLEAEVRMEHETA
ncbi:NADPH-dependent 2,4-dienoyl-CoA reductase/sulfur reductase-like enzyme/nitrite reductase/ring-hydroxylating ferredoxin subunit [Phyllobacterium sp. 1468]|uniref:FAD-dependent oxidoreductase n=1 Tax=Phyllobacterium sp. 1468 TaxID=2817759 RepID=UPI00285822AC|nr:FAD-dependent oxidoreductase [Phyllobacterium sp. 1468]MDR6631959.1 NADPH-dependent 2,4-dienoyl-CoA reductase/sulfur reductase-like enzyme/nitrite reductase/ring-hydroxylating ferredoxin subunit [Phyllobacterium sp. 1468]